MESTETFSSGSISEPSPLAHREVIDRFAIEIGVSRAVVISACSPIVDPPYLQLDAGRWDAMKASRPQRGPKSIAPIVLVQTLLALWKRAHDGAAPTMTEGQAVLSGLGIRDPNGLRAVKSCTWLAIDDQAVTIRPGRMVKAISVAKSYCIAR